MQVIGILTICISILSSCTGESKPGAKELEICKRLAGIWNESVRKGSFINIKPDCTFEQYSVGALLTKGTFRTDGTSITFYLANNSTIYGTIKDNKLANNQGFFWYRK